ncbi:hypothetical protein DE146DRAFT_213157 [Phaeosphaeria sp. MPI-PUGE-AT-0046c]|nr:hypothetical protein DE146DRAFT_213157 [Phaeosphaeria sp. MPI-PUGE-AT-0046c]
MTRVLTSWHHAPSPRTLIVASTRLDLVVLVTIRFPDLAMSSIPMLDGPSDSFPSTYIIACPETQELHRLGGYNCDLAELFAKGTDRSDIWFWNSFAKPIKGRERAQRHRPIAKSNMSSLLEQLPNELFGLVLDAIMEDRLAVLALGLASPVLYPKVLSHIHRDYTHDQVTSWAGKEVGFYGANSPITPAQIPTFESDWFDNMVYIEPWWTEYAPVSLEPEYLLHKSLTEARSRWKWMENIAWRNIDQDLSQTYLYPQDRVWVLRNLTTRQMVRSNGLSPPKAILEHELVPANKRKTHMLRSFRERYGATKHRHISPRDKALEPLTLPQVFLVLTAHSAHPSWKEEDFGFRRGPWTSHAFEVVPLDEHVASAGSVWQDVTDVIAADVGHLRWCVMQHAALSEPNVDGLWERLKEFRNRAREARVRWTKWAQDEGGEGRTATE